MEDIEFDAAPVDSRCTDARSPGHPGFINRISNRELYERHSSYPRTVDDDPVEPEDLIHIVFVRAKEDFEPFDVFLKWFKDILLTVENGETVKYKTHDSELFPCPYDDNVHDISERAMFIFPYLTKSFCTDEVLKFFTSEAIGKTRLDQTCPKGALGKKIKQQKKYAVRPIHTADPKSNTYRIPTGLTMMRGIDYYSKDKHAQYVKDQVIGIVKEAIKMYEERKRAMVNVPTTSENEMANMLSAAMKDVVLINPVTTQDDASLEVDSGPSRQHNNTTFKMAIGQQGEPLRKMENNNFLYLEGQIIYKGEHSERIGCIKVTLGKESYHGTGFRVGSKYFMTAFHVIKDVLILFWEEVYRRLTEEVQGQMEWTKDNIPVDGAWKLSKLLTFVDPSKRNELMEIGKQTITNCVQIKFGFVRDSEYSFLAQCSYDVAFASPSHDVVILELIEDINLPNPFHLKTINAAATKLHLIGHPGGRKLEHDPACKIFKNQEELENLVKKGISFFLTHSNGRFTKDQVEKDYEPCVLSPDHLLFHCSESITHGASGSPLIVIINEKEAQVIGMLLRGHPKFYYNYDKRNGDRPDLLVESGISMEKVRSLLICHSLHELAANLFPEQF